MKTLVIATIHFVVLLVIAPCARGQSRVYTNADLGHHVKSSVRVSPEEAAAIMASHLPVIDATPAPADADGPRVYIMDSRPDDGPYGPLRPFMPALRLDGTPLSQPPDMYGEPLWWFGGGSPTFDGRQRSWTGRGNGERSSLGRRAGERPPAGHGAGERPPAGHGASERPRPRP
jgi:hypothetical protein